MKIVLYHVFVQKCAKVSEVVETNAAKVVRAARHPYGCESGKVLRKWSALRILLTLLGPWYSSSRYWGVFWEFEILV